MEPTESTFRSIVEVSPYPVYVCEGEEMIVTVANNATLKAWGRTNAVIGKPFIEALPELVGQPFLGLLKHVYTTGETYNTDNDRADLVVDGTLQTFYFKFTYQAMRNNAGVITGVVCFATDVTELERSRQEVEESRLTLYNMVKQAPVGICIIRSEDMVVQVVNDSYLVLVGKKRDELENKQIWQAIPEAAEIYAPIMNSVIETGQTFFAKEDELMLIRNGVPEIVFVDFVYEPITGLHGVTNAIMVIAIDVTEKVLARRGIEEAEERARLAIEAAEIGTFDLDLGTNIMLTSDRLNAIFGFDRHVSRDEFVNTIFEPDCHIRDKAHRDVLVTGILFYEARVIWKDGSAHWVRVQGRAYLNAQQTPVRILGTVLDITEFKRLQQQKDDFISVASHELKTPMTSLKASIQLLDRMIKTQPASNKIPVFLEKANASLLKMQHLVDGLLNVSRIAAGQLLLHKTWFNVFNMVNDCCDHVRITGTHHLIITGDKELEIFADKDRIDQVMLNLLNNAVKYAPESENIIVNIAVDDDVARISVQDFGRGIPPEKIPHLFERYYRVDATGIQFSGLGLGLYISADIMERHSGDIGVASEVGKGSTFWFTLPVKG